MKDAIQTYDTIVIGGGQAGLSVGYYLQQQGCNFVILDAAERTGDSWRNRWDSLRLFTPARYDALPGMPFPAPPKSYPTKDAMADYLESYAARFRLPVRLGTRVDHLEKNGERFLLTAGEQHFAAKNVVVAMASFQIPAVPGFAQELDPDIVQMHSRDYLNPAQLREGKVLVVGAGNSGAEIALELAADHNVWLSGRHVGHVPFDTRSFAGRNFLVPLVLRFLFHRVLTLDTPIGRKVRPHLISRGGPLISLKPKDLEAVGVRRVPRVTGVQDGLPVIGDEDVLEVENVIWCTGFHPDFSWIDLPIFNGQAAPIEPEHERGVVSAVPGLYFVGLMFLYAASSTTLAGLQRDARYVAQQIISRTSYAGEQDVKPDIRNTEPAAAQAALKEGQAHMPHLK
jgi:putative flavoprotein involved in K+ transport